MWPGRLLLDVRTSYWSSDTGVTPTSSDVVVDDDRHGIYLIARGTGPRPRRTRIVQSAVAAAVSLLHRSLSLDATVPLEILARLAVEDANAVVWRQRGPGFRDTRVVMTLLLVRDDEIAIGHVGHGRVLEIADGRATALTRPHTVDGDCGRLGYLPPTPNSPLSHTLTRQLGERVCIDVDVQTHRRNPNAQYVVLSPGFERVDIAGMLGRLIRTLPPSRVAGHLIEQARTSGQTDRLSALLIPAVTEAADTRPLHLPAQPPVPTPSWPPLQSSLFRRWGRPS